jgi:hypothetical protein
MSHCCKYIINYSKSSTVDTSDNNNHLYHDYSFGSPKSNQQQRVMSPRINQLERSLSPRKFHVSIMKLYRFPNGSLKLHRDIFVNYIFGILIFS